MQNNDEHTGFKGWMRDKGYYIVLVLCIAAVRNIRAICISTEALRRTPTPRPPPPCKRRTPGAGGDGQRRCVFVTGGGAA
ncbi:MAG: hypothetical protein V8S89_01725 [Oscillospiraceae bacterium]